MNYSETYFELDSEEATHSHPLSPIVTLSVVCILKGMSTKSIQKIKAMLLCIEYGILFVDTVDTGVCGLSRKSSIPDEPVSTVSTYSDGFLSSGIEDFLLSLF